MVKSADGDVFMRSTNNIISNGKHSRKAYDQMWNVASRAPVFCKITKKSIADGKGGTKPKKFYRTTRLIGAHAIMSRLRELRCVQAESWLLIVI